MHVRCQSRRPAPPLIAALRVAMALFAAATAHGASAPPARCPSAQAPLRERFIAADCTECWAASVDPDHADRASRPGTRGWTLDWLLPRGSDAPMAAAALPAASERQARAETAPATTSAGAAGQAAWPRGALLRVESGPAWQGYFGLRLSLTSPRALPPGATAWLALVEQIPAGSEGSAVPRRLVRSVAGPLPLQALRPGQPFSHLQALRWPEGAQPARLQARGWLEAPDGRVLAMAADRCD